MAKVDIELVKVVLQRAELDAHKTAQIIEDLAFEAQALKGAEDKEPPCKKQFVVFLNDPDGLLRSPRDLIGWVAQIPETPPHATITSRPKGAECHLQRLPKRVNSVARK